MATAASAVVVVIVTRWWTDVDDRPHIELTEWRASPAGEVITVDPPAVVTEADLDLAEPVMLVTVSDGAVLLDSYVSVVGYFDMALRTGATLVDEATWQAAADAAAAEAVSVEEQIADYLAGSVPEDAGTMIDKLASVAHLSAAEKAVLTARVG